MSGGSPLQDRLDFGTICIYSCEAPCGSGFRAEIPGQVRIEESCDDPERSYVEAGTKREAWPYRLLPSLRVGSRPRSGRSLPTCSPSLSPSGSRRENADQAQVPSDFWTDGLRFVLAVPGVAAGLPGRISPTSWTTRVSWHLALRCNGSTSEHAAASDWNAPEKSFGREMQ